MPFALIEALIIKYLESHPEMVEQFAGVVVSALIKHLASKVSTTSEVK